MDAVLPSGKEAMDYLITFIKEKMTQHFLDSKVCSGDIIDNRKWARQVPGKRWPQAAGRPHAER
jgi:hypothetical protein